ncbi:hypothetical protein Ciccas_013796 [Cichlidogyrus casuarinus]|uniref:G-protein coupled receptors family 1 profile domain-containing protein n=1 Tax=Cichlidogyrus casuarinus TaxID=1844966 RepID=A0ABD2PJP0_9PLAT
MNETGNGTQIYSPPHEYIHVIRPSIVGILAALGLIGNALTIVVLKYDPQKSTPNFFMMMLAIVDKILLIIYPYEYVFSDLVPWVRSPTMDAVTMYMVHVFKAVEIYIIILISVDRFLALKFPLKSVSICRVSKARKALLVCFFFCIILNLPYLVVYLYAPLTGWQKTLNSFYEKGIREFLVYIGPFIVITYLNGCLIFQLRKGSSTMFAENTEVEPRKLKQNQRQQRHRNVSVTLLWVVICFLVFETPVYIFMNYFPIERTLYWFIAYNVMIYLSLLNFSNNFIIYGLVGNRFRNQLKDRLSKMCPCYHKKNATLLPKYKLEDNTNRDYAENGVAAV